MLRFILRAAHGYGILVPVLFFVSMFVSAGLISGVFTGADETGRLYVLLGCCAVIVTVPLWIIGRKLNRNTYDPHAFLFIPMEYWGIIVPIILAIKNWPG
ncbi:hypothetical protein LLG95_04675 [bacterium]|nr:hypothetical protein [bacterium]